ncbi:MAG: FtsX-like permease family protein [Proteobacteria bacterium]|nr:FtsX-like permease family protein [Pseudomonadota bacterium]
MRRTLRAAALRHLWRHPAQLALALLGLSLGVGTIVAVDIATASAERAFQLSLQAVNGAATHQLSAGPGGLDEQLYVRLRRAPLAPGHAAVPLAPLVLGYATLGERTLELIGIDPIASAGMSAGTAAADGLAGGADPRDWFLRPGAVVLPAAAAAQLHLARGAEFGLAIGGVRRSAYLAGIVDGAAWLDGVVLTDIAQAQEWLGAAGRLSRIDVRVPAGEAGRVALARLRALLPPAVEVHETRAQARETFAMTDAFTTNLKAMSLLALLVGTFLIYGAVSFAVLQRRTIIGVLRALGVTRAEVLRLVLGEALLLGLVGAACGGLLGLLIGRALLGLVSQTINDLYFVVAVSQVAVPATTLLKAIAVGLVTALAAALVPALEVSGATPQLGLARSVLEQRAQQVARRFVVAGVLFAALAAVLVGASGHSLLAGFAALFLLLLGVAAVTPAVLRVLALAGARVLARASAVGRLALLDVAGSLSRTGVAVAALGMALTAMIGVAVMVASFRESLREWLLQSMHADVYVSAPAPSGNIARRLDPEVVRRLLATPGVRAHSEARHAVVGSTRGPIALNALRLVPGSDGAFRLTEGEAGHAWAAFREGSILISEPLGWRLGLHPGQSLTLLTGDGARDFAIAGVYREYGNDRGEILMDLAAYRRHWHDAEIGGLGLYLSPGVSAGEIIPRLRAAAGTGQALLIRSNAEIRALSMSIFERTFIITRVLYWLAAGVAAIGLVSALLAWELERARQLALLRTLGVTPGGTALLILAQTVFMGLVALLAAVPAGILTALVLTQVINRRAFGWQIDLHLSVPQFSNALWLALAAAVAAALYPAWRSAHAPLARGLREE